jgi:cell division protein FtsW
MLSLRLPWRRPAPARAQVSGAAQAVDQTLLWVAASLLAFGMVMVYSASIALPDSPRFASLKPTHFLGRHAFSIALGVTLAVVAFATPMRVWDRAAPWLFMGGLVLLVLVLIPGIGKMVLGARRWLAVGPLSIQPSELMKLFVVLYAANYIVRRQDRMRSVARGFGPIGSVMAGIGVLLLLEPDLGAFMVICAIAMGMLFLGGVSGRLFVGLIGVLGVTFGLLIAFSPWRRERIFAYLDPFADPLGKGYQLTHALIAFGRGEFFGVGLGGSIEKLHYLPEAHTDFLLAVIGEELGLAGVMVVIVLFFWMVRRAFEIGRQAIALDRVFAGLVAKGIALWLGLQAFINMGVNLGLLPTKGLTLPLMSYGGTGILVNCVAIALILRVDFENRRLMRGAG